MLLRTEADTLIKQMLCNFLVLNLISHKIFITGILSFMSDIIHINFCFSAFSHIKSYFMCFRYRLHIDLISLMCHMDDAGKITESY